MGNFDESDHIAAGYLMKAGRLLYSEHFSHHFPFPYYWIYAFTPLWSPDAPARTLTVFRLSLLILYLVSFGLVYLSYRQNRTRIAFALWVLLLSSYFVIYHGYVVISETFSTLFLSSICALVIPVMLGWEKSTLLTRTFLIIFATCAFWTQPLMGLLFVVPLLITKPKDLLKVTLAITVLNLLPILFFWLTGQLNDFIFQGLYFNFAIYSPYYIEILHQGTNITNPHPIIFFLINEYYMFTQFHDPIQIVQFIVHLTVFLGLWFTIKTRNVHTISLFFILFIAARLREVKAVPGVAFNSGMYPFIAFGSLLLVFYIVKGQASSNIKHRYSLLVLFALTLFISAYSMYPIFRQSLLPEYNYHVFWSYRQDKGNLIKKLSKPNESVLIYPHDVELYYFADRKPPDRFTYWFPWINDVPEFRIERIMALQKNPPSVVYIGNLAFKDDPNHYARYFPNLTKGYIEVKENGKKTGILLRKDLQDRVK